MAKKAVYKHGFFKIKIPLNPKNNDLLKYSVHSSKYFIPDTFPKSRGDFREIPFKICDVYKQDSNLIASFFNNINLITSWSDSK